MSQRPEEIGGAHQKADLEKKLESVVSGQQRKEAKQLVDDSVYLCLLWSVVLAESLFSFFT